MAFDKLASLLLISEGREGLDDYCAAGCALAALSDKIDTQIKSVRGEIASAQVMEATSREELDIAKDIVDRPTERVSTVSECRLRD